MVPKNNMKEYFHFQLIEHIEPNHPTILILHSEKKLSLPIRILLPVIDNVLNGNKKLQIRVENEYL
jgi:hypothetical protein